MSNSHENPYESPSDNTRAEADGATGRVTWRSLMGWGFALLSIGASVAGFWRQVVAYEAYAGADLEMHEWFSVNVDLTVELVPYMAIASACCFIAPLAHFGARRRRRLWKHVGFAVLWLVSFAATALLIASRMP